MPFLLLLPLLFIFSGYAWSDTRVGLYGSLLYNVPEVEVSGGNQVDENSEFGFGAGVRALMGLNDRWYVRSGAGLVYKKVSAEISNGSETTNTDLSWLYLNIPATLYLKASPGVGIFGGTALQARLGDSCNSDGATNKCAFKNEKSIVLPFVLGFDFNFNEAITLEISYEGGLMESTDDVKVGSAVMSLIYNFE